MQDYDDLLKAVDAGGGVHTLKMGELRDIHGAGKLGVHVVANISNELDQRGLSHYPEDLPQNQWEHARIYKRGTSVGEFIRAALNLESPATDKKLRELASNRSDEILKRIREMVCD